MERFQYYGDLEKIVQGYGKLFLNDEKELDVSFEIAKRGEEKLLFNIISSDGTDPLDSFSLLKSEQLNRIEGNDDKGRKVIVTDLLVKDSTIGTKTDSKVILNGYAGRCEIGKKELKEGYNAHFELINFLFLGNKTKVKETKEGEKSTKSILHLNFPDFDCRIERTKDYSITRQLLKRQGGILKTSTLTTEVNSQNEYESIHENVKKLCQLLSVARSTFINWGTCKIGDTDGNVIYELHGNTITRPYHGNKLINDLPEETVRFLESAWNAYEEYEEVFDIKRFLYGYLDTFVKSFIESKSLSMAVLVDFLSSRWAKKEDKQYLLDEEEFGKQKANLTKQFSVILGDNFDNLKSSHKQAMLSNIDGFNERPLDWKLKRLRKQFQIPITDDEVAKFIKIRNSLAHTSLFPEEFESTNSYLFLRHFLDRVVLKVLGYEGKYFDMQNLTEKNLIGS